MDQDQSQYYGETRDQSSAYQDNAQSDIVASLWHNDHDDAQ